MRDGLKAVPYSVKVGHGLQIVPNPPETVPNPLETVPDTLETGRTR